MADFFRKASDTNFAAFQANVVKSSARAGLSEEAMLDQFANADIDIALAVQERNVLEGLQDYIGRGEPNAEYAELGFAINNFARNASLIGKYYSNGQIDEALSLVGVRYERPSPAASSWARTSSTRPSPSCGPGDRAGHGGGCRSSTRRSSGRATSVDKFDALNIYWGAFVSSRVLSYLGGFEQEGLT